MLLISDELKMKTQYIDKIKTNNNSIDCSICLDRRPNILYLPCKHITNCGICSEKLKKCPICLETIDTKMDIFYG